MYCAFDKFGFKIFIPVSSSEPYTFGRYTSLNADQIARQTISLKNELNVDIT